MSIGFTGTRHGMTPEQLVNLNLYLIDTVAQWIHLGDCIGADKQAYNTAKVWGLKTFGHPPIRDKYRAFCEYDAEMEPKPYMVRNAAIVKLSNILVVAPQEFTEQVRSGTWSTYRMAKHLGKETLIIYPDGETKWERSLK